MRSREFFVIALTAPALVGCGSEEKQSDYATVVADPKRDSSTARKKDHQAVELIEDGRFDEAERLLKSALTADIMYGPAHNNLGKVYYHLKKYYLAAWEFQYAIKLMPNHPEPRNNLGLVFEFVGKLGEAVEEYGAALALSPDDPELLGNLVRARIKRGDRGSEVRDLLRDLILKDSRPEWVHWAKESLAKWGEDGDPRTDQESVENGGQK